MIKILKKGEYVLDDVLIRDRSGRDVSQVVSEIVFGVKMGGGHGDPAGGSRPDRLLS